ncbi:MAG: ATP synthase F1 subunit epsilon [Oscillospiraceae bacterium]|nr:ATP synthase F1 subunit epsilon [Oscillospiraceae bacterium]
MSDKKFRLQIITPFQIKVDQQVDMVVMRCTTGDMGICPGHEDRSAVLTYGAFRILDGGTERRIAVYGGLAAVRDGDLTVLTHDAEWREEIDSARAAADRENAERRLQEAVDDIEIAKDQVLLRRALVQIEVSKDDSDQ